MNFFNEEKPRFDLPDTDRFYMLMLNLNFQKKSEEIEIKSDPLNKTN